MNVSPADFWSLTVPEWRWLRRAMAPDRDAMTRTDLDALMALYPDERP